MVTCGGPFCASCLSPLTPSLFAHCNCCVHNIIKHLLGSVVWGDEMRWYSQHNTTGSEPRSTNRGEPVQQRKAFKNNSNTQWASRVTGSCPAS